jgi:hypothetical protein
MPHERLRDIPVPESMRALPLDHRGFPVPWFVDWVDGKPEFRAMDLRKKYRAVLERRCWVCGGYFTTRKRYFVVGPMCVLNRNTPEPPCHLDCAMFSVRGCPFLSMPKMVRRESGLPGPIVQSEGHIARNPGAIAIYYTREFEPYCPPGPRTGDFLIALGEPIDVTWWAEGRPATREQVLTSIDSGLPILEAMCEKEETEALRQFARKQLAEQYREVMGWLPRTVRAVGVCGS